MNTNKIINTGLKQAGSLQKEFSSLEKFNNLKVIYDNFSKKMKTSDFSNYITRYESELSLLDNMEKVLDKQVNVKEFEFVQQAKKKAIENLEKLGVIVKEP